jgi:hypothetical protein
MGKWLDALVQAEKFSETPRPPTDKTDKTPSGEVLSVLAVPPLGVFIKILNRQQGSMPPADGPDGAYSAWRRSLGTLNASYPPTGFPALWWGGVIRDADLFLATWGKQAADLGWTTLDLFGVHPKAPAARFSCIGLLLLLRGGRVVALTTATAVIEQASGARLTYTRQSREPECVPLWELPGASRERSASPEP